MPARIAPGRPPSPATTIAAIRDPWWIAHRYDPEGDLVHLLPVPRAVQRDAIFITDDYLPAGLHPLAVRRRDAIAHAPPPAPLHFLFHSAFCCSTLLARAFDRPGWAMGLKEPMILNDLIGWRRRGGQGPDMASVLDDVLTLLARPPGPGEAVVLKPSNVANALIPAMLALRPDARALLLYAPLRTYLGSIAKKGMDGRLWVRTLLLGLLDDKLVDLGFSTRDHLGHSDLQVAGIGWLVQQALFGSVVARFGADRVRTLDSETLTADPATILRALTTLFAMPLPTEAIDEIAGGPAFTRHSKLGTAFAAPDRQREQRDASAAHADEIEKVAIWTEAVARAAGIPLTAPAPLRAPPA
jgi:hypothetical protein